MTDGPVALLRFRCEMPFGEPVDELVAVESWPLYGFSKGFTLMGMPGELEFTFDPPLVPVELPEHVEL